MVAATPRISDASDPADPSWVLGAFCGQFTAVPSVKQQKGRTAVLEPLGEGLAVERDGNHLETAGTQIPALLREVLDALTAGPTSRRRVARRLGRRKRAVLTALSALVEAGQVAREGRGRAARFRLVRSTESRR